MPPSRRRPRRQRPTSGETLYRTRHPCVSHSMTTRRILRLQIAPRCARHRCAEGSRPDHPQAAETMASWSRPSTAARCPRHPERLGITNGKSRRDPPRRSISMKRQSYFSTPNRTTISMPVRGCGCAIVTRRGRHSTAMLIWPHAILLQFQLEPSRRDASLVACPPITTASRQTSAPRDGHDMHELEG